MIDAEKTKELILLSQSGDIEAKEILLKENIPLIKSIVKRYKGKNIEYDDLMQLGSLGLVKAINNFNPDFGVRLSTYAVPMITGEIKRFIRDDGAIKVSRALKTMSYKIGKFVEEYQQNNAKEPEISVIAKQFDIDEQEVVYILDSSKMPVSIYEKNDDDNGKSLIDRLSDSTTEEDMLDKLTLKDCIQKLPQREKLLIVLRYYKDKTQSEIAKILGVSQVQVSRLESKIIEQLKKQLTA